MTYSYAQQNPSSAAAGDARSAARCFAFILVLLGTAVAVSIFVSLLGRLPLIGLLSVLSIGLILLAVRLPRRPGYRRAHS